VFDEIQFQENIVKKKTDNKQAAAEAEN